MIMIVERARILGLPRSAHRNHCAVVTAALLAASLRKHCTNYTQWHLLRFLFHISVLKAEASGGGEDAVEHCYAGGGGACDGAMSLLAAALGLTPPSDKDRDRDRDSDRERR